MKAVVVSLLLFLLVGVCSPQPQGVEHSGDQRNTEGEVEGECSAEQDGCSLTCTWNSDQGVTYSLEEFNTRLLQVSLQNPRNAILKFYLCSMTINCNNQKSAACLTVPGIKPTPSGSLPRVEQLQPNLPGEGFRLLLEEGELCAVTKKPRVTIVSLPCSPNSNYRVQNLNPRKAYEGQKNDVCKYYVEFPPSQFGCPVQSSQHGAMAEEQGPELWAVTGCSNAVPPRTTADCHYATQTKISIHGLNFHYFCSQQDNAGVTISPGPTNHVTLNSGMCTQNFKKHYSIWVGSFECKEPKIISDYIINCTIDRGSGKDLSVIIRRQGGVASDVIARLEAAVSFKEAIDFREKFSRFVELGVGGLKREIDELYRRSFASRGTSPEVLQKLGISHVKGILLYGPPGSGKTLLARTIAQILGSKQVQLINGPEIVSKYLGESERNLRAHFKEAQDAWKEHGPLSDLYIIIIDEIDAICKPRGKTDQSAAGAAYDALVNQLLTLMDGLNEVHNTLVVGLTNRRELLDPALLRPGRFEVQIEVNLPDEHGRWEIFEIHTRSMRNSSMLSSDVDLWELAANTTRFSGAEIAGVVRAAASYALDRYHSGQLDSIVVTATDFKHAIRAISPAYTHSESHVLSIYLPLGYLPCGNAHDAVIDTALDLIHTLQHSSTTRMQTLLLYGPRGSGKTTLAAQLAVLGKFSFTKILTASALVGRHDLMKIDVLYQVFNDAFRSGFSMVVLDDLHRLVEYVQVGAQVTMSHSILHAINTLLTTTPPSGSKVLVVGTMTVEDSSDLEEPSALGLPDLFLRQYYVPLLDNRSTITFLNARNIHRSGGGEFMLPSNLAISVRQLLHSIECGCAQSHALCSGSTTSYIKQDHLLDCIMAFVTRQGAVIEGAGLFPG